MHWRSERAEKGRNRVPIYPNQTPNENKKIDLGFYKTTTIAADS